jgi:ribosome-binding protein aMBF1 (putative translation factor)
LQDLLKKIEDMERGMEAKESERQKKKAEKQKSKEERAVLLITKKLVEDYGDRIRGRI